MLGPPCTVDRTRVGPPYRPIMKSCEIAREKTGRWPHHSWGARFSHSTTIKGRLTGSGPRPCLSLGGITLTPPASQIHLKRLEMAVFVANPKHIGRHIILNLPPFLAAPAGVMSPAPLLIRRGNDPLSFSLVRCKILRLLLQFGVESCTTNPTLSDRLSVAPLSSPRREADFPYFPNPGSCHRPICSQFPPSPGQWKGKRRLMYVHPAVR